MRTSTGAKLKLENIYEQALIPLEGLGTLVFRRRGIRSRRFWVRLLPQLLGDWQGIDFQILPPDHFIASLMQLPMMAAAERYGEFVADFETQRSRLRKPQVMRIGRLPAADQTGL